MSVAVAWVRAERRAGRRWEGKLVGVRLLVHIYSFELPLVRRLLALDESPDEPARARVVEARHLELLEQHVCRGACTSTFVRAVLGAG